MRDARDSRVLLVLRTPPPYGGGEITALSLLEAFRDRFDTLEFTRVRHSKQSQGRFTAENLRFGLTYVAVTAARILHSRPKVLYLDIPKDFPSFLRTSGILLVARAMRVAVVGDLAGAAFPFLEKGGWKRNLGLWFLRPVHSIRVLSPSLVSRLHAAGLDNGVSVTNGITCEAAEDVPERRLPPVPQFLYVGKLTPAKGLWTILHFLEFCRSRHREIHVHLVGEWESRTLETEVMAWVRERNLESMLTVHGLLIGEQKWETFRRATVLLHPTLWDGQPVTILEALAFGLPVIATDVGAIADTVDHGKTGFIMKESSVEEVLRGTETILADPETYSRYAGEARKAYEERFRRETFVRRMEELFMKAQTCSTHPAQP